MKTYYRIQVSGNVQGVFFRRYAQKKARELGLKGFVSNLPDGSVYIEAAGEEAKLKELAQWCYQGSPESKVTQVKVQQIQPTEDFPTFDIRYL